MSILFNEWHGFTQQLSSITKHYKVTCCGKLYQSTNHKIKRIHSESVHVCRPRTSHSSGVIRVCDRIASSLCVCVWETWASLWVTHTSSLFNSHLPPQVSRRRQLGWEDPAGNRKVVRGQEKSGRKRCTVIPAPMLTSWLAKVPSCGHRPKL